MADQCPLCERSREPAQEFCNFHLAASKNLEDAYTAWLKGYGASFTKAAYYAKLESLMETGSAVKDVIRFRKLMEER